MSKYVLSEETALILNGQVYSLVREKIVQNNSVCDQCDLYEICTDAEENRKLSDWCIPEDEDQRWFFKRHRIYTQKGAEDLVRLINKCFVHK